MDELTVHGVQEFHRQHLLTTYCFDKKQDQISQTSLYWFKLVCLEMYEERIKNKEVYNELYLKKVLSSGNKKYF